MVKQERQQRKAPKLPPQTTNNRSSTKKITSVTESHSPDKKSANSTATPKVVTAKTSG